VAFFYFNGLGCGKRLITISGPPGTCFLIISLSGKYLPDGTVFPASDKYSIFDSS
jgi:hypothetical protein